MRNYIARYKLRIAIQFHIIMRDNARHMVSHGIGICSPSHQVYVQQMNATAAREQRCIDRIQKLLDKYK
jgi:hypothetical protein